TVIWQCGSADEAARANAAGADAIIAQGFEAGGHVRGVVTTLALVPEIRDAIGELPMLAAGGLADGRGLAAVLALGADGAVFGTRFIASHECAAHPDYKRRIVAAHAAETFHTKLYDIGWPDAAHRTLRTALVEDWERAGRPESGRRPGEGASNAKLIRPGLELPLANYSVSPPSEEMEGDLSGLAWYAGQSVTQVREIMPAGEIVRQIAADARAVITGLQRVRAH
ncbi:MAG TPA: nitronate monooxygenase, partial [Candidatus Binataceae bacterium]|nr:nitronate monooxygenase [Candidatus Binataceae bacterium]